MEVRRPSVTTKVMDVSAVPKEKGGRMDPIGAAKPNGVSSKGVAGGKLGTLRTLSGGRGDKGGRGALPVDGLLVSKPGMITSGPLPYSGDLGSNGGGPAGVGGGAGVGGAGGSASQSFVELSRRRLANDPAMMRELKRYQELMLQTLLPTISGSDGEHHHALPRPHHSQDSPDALPAQRGQPDGTDDPDRTPSEHLPRPEPTDGISGTTQHLRRTSSFTTKSACSHESPSTRTMPPGPASAGTRLPHTIYNPMDTSPRPSHRRRNSEEVSPRWRSHRGHEEGHRRRSHGDEAEEEEEEEEEEHEDTEPSRVTGGNAGELDLLTLAALYLESRHRVFGQELYHRPDAANTRTHTQLGGTGVGGPGIARPRRLSPLSPSDSSPKEEKEDSIAFSAVMPTPAGLHLSVNYTQNLGLEESMFLAERARALRPRLRRLNSLDDLLPSASSSASSANYLQKATSAPDLSSSSSHVRKGNVEMVLSRVSSQDSLSPSLVTPARANTPTEARHSAALVRPQMVGGSLATNSTVDTSRRVSTYGNGQDAINTHLTKKRQLSHLPESSKSSLPPPRLSLRSSRLPQESMARELPRTPPPTASEGMRRMGRVHLEPLRKSSH